MSLSVLACTDGDDLAQILAAGYPSYARSRGNGWGNGSYRGVIVPNVGTDRGFSISP
jgi:hypothetical protein